MAKKILFKRGLESARSQITPAAGEPIFTTDTKKVFIGDGVTKGGIPVGALKTIGTIKAGQFAVFNDDQGEALKSVAVANMLVDYTTKAFLETRLTQQLAVKVDAAKKADDSLLLNGRSDYLTPDKITNSFTEDDATKIASAKAVKALYDVVQSSDAAINTSLGMKVDKSSVVNSVTSTSATLPAAAGAVKTAYDAAVTAGQKADTASSRASAAQSTANTARTEAAAARTAPDLYEARKRIILYGTAAPSGGAEEGTVYIQY